MVSCCDAKFTYKLKYYWIVIVITCVGIVSIGYKFWHVF